jgi:predicted ATPase
MIARLIVLAILVMPLSAQQTFAQQLQRRRQDYANSVNRKAMEKGYPPQMVIVEEMVAIFQNAPWTPEFAEEVYLHYLDDWRELGLKQVVLWQRAPGKRYQQTVDNNSYVKYGAFRIE